MRVKNYQTLLLPRIASDFPDQPINKEIETAFEEQIRG
jgi:hypothetical protein